MSLLSHSVKQCPALYDFFKGADAAEYSDFIVRWNTCGKEMKASVAYITRQ